jgi:hypothetical protein
MNETSWDVSLKAAPFHPQRVSLPGISWVAPISNL